MEEPKKENYKLSSFLMLIGVVASLIGGLTILKEKEKEKTDVQQRKIYYGW